AVHERLLELHVARRLDQELRQRARFEAPAGRERVLGVAPCGLRPERLEPAKRLVEALPDQPLEPLVASRALRSEALPLEVAPHDARGEEHRAAGARSLLEHARLVPELPKPRGGDEA